MSIKKNRNETDFVYGHRNHKHMVVEIYLTWRVLLQDGKQNRNTFLDFGFNLLGAI